MLFSNGNNFIGDWVDDKKKGKGTLVLNIGD